jgi:hypothetical protein
VSILRSRHVARLPTPYRHVASDVQLGVELDLSTSDTSFSASPPSPPPSPVLLLSSSSSTSVDSTPDDSLDMAPDSVLDPPQQPVHVPLPIVPLCEITIPPEPIHPTPNDHTAPIIDNIDPVPTLPTIVPVLDTITTGPPPPITPPQQVLLCTYNIVSGRGSRLIAAVSALEVMHVDIAILTEAKINDNIYPRSYMGYQILATPAPSINQGGIALAWRERDGFSVESVTIHGPNIMSFQLVSSGYRWLIAAVYMSPSEPATDICQQLLQLRNKYTNLPIIITGDLNINLDTSTFNQRDQEIFDTLEMIGVNNMIKHFCQRRNF